MTIDRKKNHSNTALHLICGERIVVEIKALVNLLKSCTRRPSREREREIGSMSTSETSTSKPIAWVSIVTSLAVTVAVAVAFHYGPARTHGRERLPHAIYWVSALILVGVLPLTVVAGYIFTALTATAVGTIFPIYESVRAVCTPEEEDDKTWLQYWLVGGVLFICTEWVDDLMSDTTVVYWYGATFFVYIWLFYPKTDGAALIYETITFPFIAPKVRPLADKMSNMLTYFYQTMVNAVHLWIIWIIFMFLPAGLKRLIAVLVGTVYPLISSITAASTEEVEDDTYWLTYWSVYGCLFLIMELLETWIGWVPGFYTLVILAEIYLMLPMMQVSKKCMRL